MTRADTCSRQSRSAHAVQTAQVIDVDPYRKVNEFSDLSNVAKYEMPDDEYSKRQGRARE